MSVGWYVLLFVVFAVSLAFEDFVGGFDGFGGFYTESCGGFTVVDGWVLKWLSD